MFKFNLEEFKSMLELANIAYINKNNKGTLTYMHYGLEIRNRLYSIYTGMLKKNNFSEISLTDLILKDDIEKLDIISKVSDSYFSIKGSNLQLAAGHEVSFYLFLKNYFHLPKMGNNVTNFYHFGSVYRTPKNTKFPFNLGERKSFLECYSIYKKREDAVKGQLVGIELNRKIIKQIFRLPSVEVNRPLVTNKKFSKNTVCIDVITPFGATIITGMSYLHDDIFTRIFNIKYKKLNSTNKKYYYSCHFGISENFLFSYLVNAFYNNKLHLLSILAPYHFSVIYDDDNVTTERHYQHLISEIKKKNIRYKEVKANPKKFSKLIEYDRFVGIPVTIIAKKSLIGDGKIRVAFENIEFDTTCSEFLDTAIGYLTKNDKKIFDRFSEIENCTVIFCKDFSSIQETIKRGLIAIFYCNNCDSNVINVESKLIGGEILGFQYVPNSGIDILTNLSTDWMALYSKRL